MEHKFHKFLTASATIVILISEEAFFPVNKKALIIVALLLLPALSGCVGPQEIYRKMVEFFTRPPEYEWIKIITVEEEFGWMDIVNEDFAKVSEYPFVIKNETKYLRIYMEVNFSNPISPRIESLNQGHLNITILSPSENYTKTYCTTLKSNEYVDYFYFADPEPGGWKIIVKVVGYGKYKLVAKVYQPT